MKAAVLNRPHEVQIEERSVPEPRPGWVNLAVDAAGICGTDMAVFVGDHPAQLPVVMGHEFCGRVVAVGKQVEGIEVGQSVMAEGSWDDSGHADDGALRSAALGRTANGCFADVVTVPATAVHFLPENVSSHSAQSITTLATAIHAVFRAGDIAGQRVAVVGPGHAGLLLLQVIRASGVASTTVVGTRDGRLAVAQELGADTIVNIRTPEQELWSETDGRSQFDVVFEASGRSAGLAQAIDMVRPGGKIVCYGIINEPLDNISGYHLYAKELNILGARGAGERYDEAIQLLATGAVDVDPLVSHVLPLDRAAEAFDLLLERTEHVLRVVLVP